MRNAEVVHAAPRLGLTFSECCDRTAAEFRPSDRIGHDPSEVTCGRFTETDELLLSHPLITSDGWNIEQLLFEMAVSVRTMCGTSVSLQQAYSKVRAAVAELTPSYDPAEPWPAALMVRIVARAAELARP